MKFEKINCGSEIIAIVSSDVPIITNVDSALDLLLSAKYEAGTKWIVVDKKFIVEDFFILSSGLAGEILQKYINYSSDLTDKVPRASRCIWFTLGGHSIKGMAAF